MINKYYVIYRQREDGRLSVKDHTNYVISNSLFVLKANITKTNQNEKSLFICELIEDEKIIEIVNYFVKSNINKKMIDNAIEEAENSVDCLERLINELSDLRNEVDK